MTSNQAFADQGTAAPPLDIFSAFAAVAAAIAIAYAGLEAKRYKSEVSGYARRRLEGKEEKGTKLIALIMAAYDRKSLICTTIQWVTLYHYGRLSEWEWDGEKGKKIPEPSISSRDANSNHNIQERTSRRMKDRALFNVYEFFFITNLDKIVSIALGIVSIIIIWFATIDRWDFPVPTLGMQERMNFFSSIFYFYVLLILISTLFAIKGPKWWPKADRVKDKEYKNGKIIQMIMGFIGAVALYFVTGNKIPIPSAWQISEVALFRMTAVILMTAVLIPAMLLYFGNFMTSLLKYEIDNCIVDLRALVDEAPEKADEPKDSSSTKAAASPPSPPSPNDSGPKPKP